LAIIIYPLFHLRRSFNIPLFYCQRTNALKKTNINVI